MEIQIRECRTVEEFRECVRLQREVFALPDGEISPIRHFVVGYEAGGFTLGAFAANGKLAGFVLSNAAFDTDSERFYYSHMTAVSAEFQNLGIGARLKWAQRDYSLKSGVKTIKWTFQPVQARNAFFNLEKLGAFVGEYKPNFYGTDYSTSAVQNERIDLDSDRLFAEWHLESEKVSKLANGETFEETGEIIQKIEIPNDWNLLVKTEPQKATAEQTRIKSEFQKAFAENLAARGFEKSRTNPGFLLYRK